ncbi:alpha/beta hydrolase, partial [Acinetobacter baumannii]
MKQEVENAGHEAVVPQFPTPDGQKFSAWRKVFEEQVGQLDHEMILVGHSVGAGFVLRMLDEANDHPVKAAFLVAGFLGKL